jgi:hypothetical protein
MNRRNFNLALTVTVIAFVVLARKRLRQIGSQCFYSGNLACPTFRHDLSGLG